MTSFLLTLLISALQLIFLCLTDSHKDRGFKGKKPNSCEGPSLLESSGFNVKRQEFDTEYDNDAEQILAEMEFKDTDTEEERELKLRVLRIYSKRYICNHMLGILCCLTGRDI